MADQTRNMNPTPAAKVAVIIWGAEYAKQRGGSMDFWDQLSRDRKLRCNHVVVELLATTPLNKANQDEKAKTTV